MTVTPDTKISAIIRENKAAIDALAGISKHFNKLKNPVLRKVMAPRVTVSQAARIGKVTTEKMLKALENAGFTVENQPEDIPGKDASGIPATEIDRLPTEDIETLDVRNDIRQNKDPFNRIMTKVSSLKPGKYLLLVNSFEPIPLINILTRKGFRYFVRKEATDRVLTYFHKAEEVQLPGKKEGERENKDTLDRLLEKYRDKLRTIDVRDMEMPQPMVTILEMLNSLPRGHALYVHHKRIPQFLLPELDKRGFRYYFKEQSGNNVKMLIHHA